MYERIKEYLPDNPDLCFGGELIEGKRRVGRPRKTPMEKIVSGTYELRDHMVVPQLKPLDGVPLPPDHLSPVAKQAWVYIGNQLHEMGVLTSADGILVELLCETYSRMRQAQRAIDEHGSLTYNTGRAIKPLPEVAIVTECTKMMHSLMSKCGLNPFDRARLSLPDSGVDHNPFGDL